MGGGGASRSDDLFSLVFSDLETNGANKNLTTVVITIDMFWVFKLFFTLFLI